MVLGQGSKGKRQKPKSFVTLMQTSAKRNCKNSKKIQLHGWILLFEEYLLDSVSLCILKHGRCKNLPPFSPFSQPPPFSPFTQSPFHFPLPFSLFFNPPPFFPIPYPFDTFYAGHESTSFPGSTSDLWVGENPGYEVQTKWGKGTRYRYMEDGNLTSIKEKHI